MRQPEEMRQYHDGCKQPYNSASRLAKWKIRRKKR